MAIIKQPVYKDAQQQHFLTRKLSIPILITFKCTVRFATLIERSIRTTMT